jgi:hypothetical protein
MARGEGESRMLTFKQTTVLALTLSTLLFPATLNAAMRQGDVPAPGFAPPSFSPMNPESDTTYPARVTWAGVGQLQAFSVTNVALLGLYEIPIGWLGYDGTWPDDVTNWNGFCCEWPAGSKQYYNFSTGMWIGGIVPRVVGTDTAFVPIVATGAYDPDYQPVSPLWASNQYIVPAEEGNLQFVQPGEDPAPGQLQWGNPEDFSEYDYYAQTDTASINPRRRAAFGTSEYDLLPTDFVSQMDTYCMLGDHVPEEGRFLYPADGYDAEPLGIRLEQRTYSWAYGPAAHYVYIDYKITNMNEFDIEDLYIGYFMDNDVGAGALEVEGVGPNDDLIGFDTSIDLGYTYDANFNEPGWATTAGYIGVVFCETPTNPGATRPLGLTAFSTWTREGAEGDVDLNDMDDRKYAELRGTDIPDDPDDRIYETFEEPQDVRHLSCSGPYHRLLPGETVSVTLAIVMGQSLDELKANTGRAIQQFEMGYLGTAPPPPPQFVATPQDQRVYLSWDNSAEGTVDLITGEQDFEGYRVYRSRTGVEGSWALLADYDLLGSQTPKAVKVSYKRGGGELLFGFDSFWGIGSSDSLSFVGNDYSLEFQTDTTFMVFNTEQLSQYVYNVEARDVFTGDFCVVDPADEDNVYEQPDPNNEFLGQWQSGAKIYIDGFYITITAGEPDAQDPEGTVYVPSAGDLFLIETFGWQEVGDQTGIHYSYLDEGLINGLTYYYSVTSYDKGSPVNDIEPLESSINQVKVAVVPRSRSADREDPAANYTRVSPAAGTGEFYLDMIQPTEITGHRYQVDCVSGGGDEQAWWWILRDLDQGSVISDTMPILVWDFDDTSQARTVQYPEDLVNQLPLDGMLMALKAPKRIWVDEVGWGTTSDVSWVAFSNNWNQYPDNLEPYDYAMTFPVEGGVDVQGNPIPFHIINLTLNEPAKTFLWQSGAPHPWESRDQVFILKQDSEQFASLDAVIRFSMDMSDSTSPAGTADTLYIKTMKPFYPGDAYQITTAHMLAPTSDYSLDNVRVVPNPYYIRAMWDTNQYNRWVNFTHLPSRCTIRIFTTSGLLVRTVEHDVETDDGTERWNLLTEEDMHCTSGLYVFQVEDHATGETAVGKFAIVR